MTRSLPRLAWTAALATYLLVVLGGIVRITGSGLGCGDEWPICHGRLIPSFADIPTLIEWSHRLVAAIVSTLVALLAVLVWRARRQGPSRPGRLAYLALGILMVQVLLGAVTVRLHLPPWTVVLHLGTARLLLATLIAVALHLTPGASPGFQEVEPETNSTPRQDTPHRRRSTNQTHPVVIEKNHRVDKGGYLQPP